MSDVDRLLADYIAEHRAGGEADPREYLSRASSAQRTELAALIDAYLARAPRQQFNETEFRGSRAERTVDELERAIAGKAGLWPAMLPQLRDRAGLKRSELVERLAAALGVGDRRDKVAGYYHEMEQGLLPAAGVSDRVLDALGRIVGETTQALRDAGRALTPAERGPGRAGGRVRAPRLRRAGRRPVAGHPTAARPASGTRSTSCSAAPDVRFRPPIRPSRGSTMSDAHDPAALVRHAVQAGDWRLVELIARMLARPFEHGVPRGAARLRHARRETRPERWSRQIRSRLMVEIERAAEAFLAGIPSYVWDGATLPVPIEEIADTHVGLLVRDVEDLGAAPGAPAARAGPGALGVAAARTRRDLGQRRGGQAVAGATSLHDRPRARPLEPSPRSRAAGVLPLRLRRRAVTRTVVASCT